MKKIIVPIIVLLLTAGCLFGINAFTSPIIEKHLADKASGEYAELMPDGKGFEKLDLSTLKDVDSVVGEIVEETSGLGYIIKVNTRSSYTPAGSYLSFTMVVSAQGDILDMKLTNYEDSNDFGADYPKTYIGQNATLADVNLVAGVTYSSSAFKEAVQKVFATLVANDMVKEAKKSNEQILKEMIVDLDSAFGDLNKNPKFDESKKDGAVIKTSYKALNGAAMGYIVSENDTDYLVLVNSANGCVAYDVEGNVATLSDDTLNACKQDASSALKTYAYSARFEANYAEATIQDAIIDSVFSSVVYACTIETAEETLYGYTARTYGFGGEIMEISVVVDANGVIKKTWAQILVFEAEYFSGNPFNASTTQSYYAGYVGLNAETFTSSVALMTGATITSNAYEHAVKDILAAHTVVGGAN